MQRARNERKPKPFQWQLTSRSMFLEQRWRKIPKKRVPKCFRVLLHQIGSVVDSKMIQLTKNLPKFPIDCINPYKTTKAGTLLMTLLYASPTESPKMR